MLMLMRMNLPSSWLRTTTLLFFTCGLSLYSSETKAQSSGLTMALVLDSAVTCNGFADGAASANVSAGSTPYTYHWSNGATSASIGGLSAGTYTATVTDNSGISVIDSFAVPEPTMVQLGFSSNSSTCGNADGDLSVFVSGGSSPYSVQWGDPGASTTQTAIQLAAGAYGVTVTDNAGCTNTALRGVTDLGAPTATFVAGTDVSCAGGSNGSATVSAMGGSPPYAYAWTPSGGTGTTANGLTAGNYCVVVTDATGCVATSCVTISTPTALAASVTASTDATCSTACDATVTATATGGMSPYSSFWSNGAGTNSTATGLCTNTVYTWSVTDGNGCQVQVDHTPTAAAAIVPGISDVAASCPGGLNGALTAAAAGGMSPYSYSWSTGATTGTINQLMPGTYTVTVVDATGCTAAEMADVQYSCAQVDGLRHLNLQDVSVRLAWDTVCGATKYKITYKVWGTSNWMTKTKQANVGAYQLSGLMPNTRYGWRVRAFCEGNDNFGAAAVLEDFTTLPAACQIPDGVAANPVGMDKARLNWNKKSQTLKYRLRYRIAGQAWNVTIIKDSVWDRHWLTGLSPSTLYEWQIKAVCDQGISSGTNWSAMQSFSTASAKYEELLLPAGQPGETVELVVYPNPFRERVYVQVMAPKAAWATASIYDVSGKLLLQQRIATNHSTPIESTLPAGIYLLRVNASNWIKQQRLVVH